MTEEKNSNSLKELFSFGEVFGYFFRKKDPNQKPDLNLRMMHGINKIAITVFLLAIVYFVITRFVL